MGTNLIHLLFLIALVGCSSRPALYLENDIGNIWNNKDRYYSSGLKLELEKEGWSYGIGNHLYTPDDIRSEVINPNDRPYAGWTYAEIAHEEKEEESSTKTGLQVGCVGPCSGGKEVQEFFHNDVGWGPDPTWVGQLRNEPTLGAIIERRSKIASSSFLGSDIEVIGKRSASIGTPLTQGTVGGLVRFGALPEDFGISGIFPRTRIGEDDNGSGFPTDKTGSSKWHAYIFGGLEGRAVAYSVFLDGNTFRESHSVEREPLVGEASAGFSFGYGDWSFSYTYIAISKEFEEQDGGYSFGTITIRG